MSVLHIIFIFIFLIILGGLFDAPFLPTPKKDFKKIGDLINPPKGSTVYDLGSGTGELLFYLNKKYGTRGVGIEISPFLYLFSKLKARSVKDVDIIYGNFHHKDISNADTVYMFLTSAAADKAKKEILPKMKKGSFLLVSGNEAEGLVPLRSFKEKGKQSYYLYRKN